MSSTVEHIHCTLALFFTMSVVSLAIVGKANTPIYLKEFLEGEEDPFGQSSASCSLKQQFILHAALDRFEQLSGPPPGCAWREKEHRGDTAMFAGLLCPVEDMRVYGECDGVPRASNLTLHRFHDNDPN